MDHIEMTKTQIKDEMKQNVQDFLGKMCKAIGDEFESHVFWNTIAGKIESPIEQMFAIAWEFESLTRFCNFGSGKRIEYNLIPQFEIKEKNKTLYRLDFTIFKGEENLKVGIELDSFAFHEKDKKQFDYEKKRDRYLHLKNWKVFRFTGAEIVRNPLDCVIEIYDYLNWGENAQA